MAIRFRRSLKIAPGVRLNLGKRGVSVSAGVRGASVTAGARGVYGNVGVPGSGLSVRKKLGGGSSRSAAPAGSRGEASANVKLALKDDGSVELTDATGNPLPESVQRRARKEGRATIEAWLEQNCDHWNQGVRDILDLHLKTPPPHPSAGFDSRDFSISPPSTPRLRKPSLLDRIVRSRRERIEALNRQIQRGHEQRVEEWESAKEEHRLAEEIRRQRFESAQRGDRAAMTEVLEEHIGSLSWPRETSVAFEVHGEAVWLDVDLPEIEDLPTEHATVAKRGLKIDVKKKGDAQLRREYMTHVHAVGFRLVGESFHLLPQIRRVVVSGYTQRADRKTGHTRDDYIFSVVVQRDMWASLNFEALSSLELPECVGQFEIRREMSKTGIFKPIEPFAPGELSQ